MTSCDTNILFAVCNRDSVHHHSARAFLAAAGPESPSSLIVAELRHIGGALARVDEDGGALDHIEGEYLINGVGLAAGPEMAAKAVADLDQLMAAIGPWANGSKLFNFSETNFELSECLPAGTIDRLCNVLDEYCPDRLFVSPRSAG